jgi:hypothetical protein
MADQMIPKYSPFKKHATIFLEVNINIFILTDERIFTLALIPISNTE